MAPREVDRLPTPSHVRPMKVIGLGPSRTGTLGLYTALKTLGYKPYHISELLPYELKQMRVLQEGIESNDRSRPFGRPEFDKMWAQYDCIIESPCYFCPSVVEAYLQDPDVKFILTERSPESFVKSIGGSLIDYYVRLRSFPLCLTKYFDSLIYHIHGMFGAMSMRWSGGIEPSDPRFKKAVQENYVQYLEQVKQIVPPERLLVLSLEKGFGWDEICGFLDRPVPDEPYPRLNAMSDFHVLANMVVGPSLRKTRIGLSSTAVAVLSLGAFWYLRKR